MTDKIGVLGEATDLTVSTHTPYTVPAGKAAKCQIQVKIEGYTEINQEVVDPIISQPLGFSVEEKSILMTEV